MAEETITEEQIAKNYTAMGHSVDVINNGTKEIWMSDEQWAEVIERNKEHLRMMRAKDYWTDEDMTAVDAAIGD
jgi:prophage antirepressor-like protein